MGYRDRIAEAEEAGAQVVALSVDPLEDSRWFAEEMKLPFPLLGDTDKEITQAWGLFNDHEHHRGIAFPATFVIDSDRRVRFRSLEKLHARVDPTPVLAALRSGPGAPTEAAAKFLFPKLGYLWRHWGRIQQALKVQRGTS